MGDRLRAGIHRHLGMQQSQPGQLILTFLAESSIPALIGLIWVEARMLTSSGWQGNTV